MASVFVLTRAVVFLSSSAYFEPSSYRHLAAADALQHGAALPNFYTDPAFVDQALEAVPGYAYFLHAVWTLLAGITLDGVLIAQAVIALLGYLALAHLISLWVSRRAAIATFVLLSLAPPLAWLEHSLTPVALFAPSLLIAVWLATVAGPPAVSWRARVAGGLGAGAFAAVAVLVHAAAQLVLPLLWLVGVGRRAAFLHKLGWTAFLLAGAALVLGPWLVHNHDRDGAWRVHPAITVATPKPATAADWKEAARTHVGAALALFVRSDDPRSRTLAPLVADRDRYLDNPHASDAARNRFTAHTGYTFSNDFVAASTDLRNGDPRARAIVERWIAIATIDGGALLAAFLMASLLIFQRAPERRMLLLSIVGVPLVFLVAFSFTGTAEYRLQAALHPFMLAAFMVACATLLGSTQRRLPRGLTLRRRLGTI